MRLESQGRNDVESERRTGRKFVDDFYRDGHNLLKLISLAQLEIFLTEEERLISSFEPIGRQSERGPSIFGTKFGREWKQLIW